MQRDLRLTERKQFSFVQREGRGWSDRLLVLKAVPNGLEHSRFGFSVGRRVGTAVVRNRVKRRLRAVVSHAPVVKGWDIVFIARDAAASADYQELREAGFALLSRAHLLAEGDQQ